MADIRDYIGNADAFPSLRKWAFFNHAGVAPLPRLVGDAIRQFAAEAERGAYLETRWYADLEKLRADAANLIRARPDEIALIKNTSEGLGIVASGLDWQWGDRIVTTNVEYPANIYPWMDVVRAHGAKLIQVEEETDAHGHRFVPIEKILAAAEDPRTRLLTLSHVEFASGQRHDLVRIGEFCRSRGILFCIDAIQTLGIIPIDVGAMKIDYLSADGHKWLLGPEGAGIFYCRRELVERTRPLMIGWMNVINADDHGNYDFRLRADARRFECGSHAMAGFLGLKAAIELLTSIGADAIFDRIKLLTDLLSQGVRDRGYHVISPRGFGQWSGGVSFVAPDPHQHNAIQLMLRNEHHVEIAVRERRLRASPHFYNTQEQVDQLLRALPRF